MSPLSVAPTSPNGPPACRGQRDLTLEAAVVKSVAVYGVTSLAEAVGLIKGELQMRPATAEVEHLFARLNSYEIDFSDVRGQEFAKRALVVTASGAHNVLMLWTILAHLLGCHPPQQATGLSSRSRRRSM